jgi:RNA polymerase sigma factor (sigma-70 family)
MTGEELFLSSLDVIERACRYVSGRAKLSFEDAEDLASAVKLRLIEDDYAVLRKFQGRCSLATYVASIAHRLFADDWMHVHGRWRPSAAAKRLGEAAILLEGLLLRDRATFAEALATIQGLDPTFTAEAAESIAKRLPPRTPRPRLVAIEKPPEPVLEAEIVEERIVDRELDELAAKANAVARRTLATFSLEDRVALVLHYQGMRVADIARALQCDQKQLYRRIESMGKRLKTALVRAGIDRRAAEPLIGGAASRLDFGLGDAENADPRQAKWMRASGKQDQPE